MEIIGCGKGHYYNPELYSSCPECAKEAGAPDFLGATEPVDFGKYAGNFSDIGAMETVDFNSYADGPGYGGDIGKTEPVNGGYGSFGDDIGKTEPVNGGYGSFGGGAGSTEPVNGGYGSFGDDIGKTEPVNGGYGNFGGGAGSTEPVNGGYGAMLHTSDFRSNDIFGGGKVQNYGATIPVPDPGATNVRGSAPFMPVVGWLVCVDGPAKGRDFRIHSQYNYIGRGQHMDICISGDNCISTDRAAVIAYDAQEKFFSFGPGMGHNVVRVNGKMLMNAVVLNPFDELTIGMTKLLFVPLCGERFDWNGK